MSEVLYKQKAVLDRWLKSLIQIPEVDLIWLEGSLVGDNRGTPSSDIDIRFGIADEAYENLWKEDPRPLLQGMGEYLPLEGHWRILTAQEGLIVEIMAFPTSELDGKELFEWEVLFSRLPEGKPAFKKLPKLSADLTWPHPEALSAEKVSALTSMFLNWLATSPTPFYNREIYSARFSLELLRAELMKLLFRRAGVSFFKRYKHLSEVLPEEFISDLESTHVQTVKSPLDLGVIAEETLRVFEVAGKHLFEMGLKAGGGFESVWYDRLLSQIKGELRSASETPEHNPAG